MKRICLILTVFLLCSCSKTVEKCDSPAVIETIYSNADSYYSVIANIEQFFKVTDIICGKSDKETGTAHCSATLLHRVRRINPNIQDGLLVLNGMPVSQFTDLDEVSKKEITYTAVRTTEGKLMVTVWGF